MRKLKLVSLLLLAALLSAASINVPIVTYGQDWLIGSPEPETPPPPPPSPSLTPPATAQQPQQPENMTSYCAPEYVVCEGEESRTEYCAHEYVVCEGEAMPSSRTTTNMTTDTTATTTLAQDPEFVRFGEVAEQCVNSAAFGSSGATMTQEQCTQFLEQGQEKWCGLAAYDAQKCEHTSRITAAWNNLVNLSEGFGFSDIPSLGELGIDPRTIAPSP